MQEVLAPSYAPELVTNIPELQLARDMLRLQAEARMQQLRSAEVIDSGDFADVDPISSARDALGGSEVANERAAADAAYTLHEAIAQTSGHQTEMFEANVFEWTNGDFTDGQFGLTEVGWRGLTPQQTREAELQREAEFVDCALVREFAMSEHRTSNAIVTVSLPAKHESHIMLRHSRVVGNESDMRVVAQTIAVPDSANMRSKLNRLYRNTGVDIDQHSRQDVLVNPLQDTSMNRLNLSGWLERAGIYSADEVQDIERSSESKRKLVRKHAPQLGAFAIELAEQNVSPQEAQPRIEKEVKDILLKLAYADPEFARDVFGDKVAEHSQDLTNLVRKGGSKAQAGLIKGLIQLEAPEVMYCGTPGQCDTSALSHGERLLASKHNMSSAVHIDNANCPDCGGNQAIVELKENGKKVCASKSCHQKKRAVVKSNRGSAQKPKPKPRQSWVDMLMAQSSKTTKKKQRSAGPLSWLFG